MKAWVTEYLSRLIKLNCSIFELKHKYHVIENPESYMWQVQPYNQGPFSNVSPQEKLIKNQLIDNHAKYINAYNKTHEEASLGVKSRYQIKLPQPLANLTSSFSF